MDVCLSSIGVYLCLSCDLINNSLNSELNGYPTSMIHLVENVFKNLLWITLDSDRIKKEPISSNGSIEAATEAPTYYLGSFLTDILINDFDNSTM